VIALPPGSFQSFEGRFIFEDADRTIVLRPLDLERFDYSAELRNVEVDSTSDPVRITIAIGNDRGTTTDYAAYL